MTDFNFKLIRPIPWNEIWADWRTLEEDHWREHYQARGFQTWDEWRGRYWKSIKPESRIWNLMKIQNPESDIPKLYTGPFRGWAQYYSDREHSTFGDVAKLALKDENKSPTQYFVKNFPKSMRFIGLQYKDKIMIMEGSHRCFAASYLVANNQSLNSEIEIAITKLNDQDQQLFENLWKHPIPVPFEQEL